MTNVKEFIQTRKDYIELIKRELLGPGSEICLPDIEHELITGYPSVRYSVGVLFPKENKMNADNDDSIRVEEYNEDSIDDEETENKDIIQGNNEKTNPYFSPEEENLDEEIGMASQNMPSSMGITFFARGESSVVNCKVKFATYRKSQAPDCCIPFCPKNPDEYEVPNYLATYIRYDKENRCLRIREGAKFNRSLIKSMQNNNTSDVDEYNLFDIMRKLCDQLSKGHVRIPHEAKIILEFDADYIDKNNNIDGTSVKITALRRQVKENIYSVTIMLVNDSDKSQHIFQPEIIVSTEDNSFVFNEYGGILDFNNMDDEEKSLALQYRNKKSYGTGLGTSINWEINSAGEGVLFNDYFPSVEVPQMDFRLPENSGVNSRSLSMKYLSDLNNIPKEEKINDLRTLVEAYGKWIDEKEDKVKTLNSDYPDVNFTEIAENNIAGCRLSYKRMIQGLEAISSDEMKWNAFTLANRAMFMQRVHIKLQAKTADIDRYPGDCEISNLLDSINYKSDDGLTSDSYFWRPFQIAFLLMSINGISDDNSIDRTIVDLIWFPTGGGKTEAYLGLTAYTIFYRRLAHIEESTGTTVIMRYTLRLLAAQQFTRASTLICACEFIRNDCASPRPKYKKYFLGKESITIGLWIGGDHTPNRNAEAKQHLDYLQKANVTDIKEIKESHSKFQVLKCPWCGTKLVKDRIGKTTKGVFAYKMKNNRHFEMYCPQESCFFNTKLPIQIVDEELYSTPPTLLFGTVDKFAMLPWKKEIGSFFALNNKNRAPELIIQDELHLISGPLGTMVGLYESAIDFLCRSKGSKTKIVASTATIRRAVEQCAALYDRDVCQFPHPAIDAEDSFFARELSVKYEEEKYGRMYVGLMPSGKTKAMMEVRTIAAMLQEMQEMQLSDEIKDKYWTLTVYFNSLKDLGKCATLVDDDIKDFIKRIAFRLGTTANCRALFGADELTSRVSTTVLNETLDKLEKLEYSKDNIENKRYATNVLLATNMISVGIDIARLNVMLLVGQPKLTSEYIQASSRIGRSYPGVAFALYDGSKSRDRSHYEQFKQYHESFYRFVEPTGATPFSKPACDRALHAVVITMLRQLVPDLLPEKGAALFTTEKYQDDIKIIKDFIISREKSVVERLNDAMENDGDRIASEIDRILSDWQRMAECYDEENFEYGERFLQKHPEENQGRLMKVFGSDQYDLTSLDTMTSMRNVSVEVVGNVLIWED